MKLDKLKFAKLVQYLAQYDFNGDVETVDELIDIAVPDAIVERPAIVQIDAMLKAIAENRKIDAIREYRAMTGMSLKESKDAIEAYWLRQPA